MNNKIIRLLDEGFQKKVFIKLGFYTSMKLSFYFLIFFLFFLGNQLKIDLIIFFVVLFVLSRIVFLLSEVCIVKSSSDNSITIITKLGKRTVFNMSEKPVFRLKNSSIKPSGDGYYFFDLVSEEKKNDIKSYKNLCLLTLKEAKEVADFLGLPLYHLRLGELRGGVEEISSLDFSSKNNASVDYLRIFKWGIIGFLFASVMFIIFIVSIIFFSISNPSIENIDYFLFEGAILVFVIVFFSFLFFSSKLKK